MRTEAGIPLKDNSILSLQLEKWSDVWRSRHHIMSRLAKENTVLFASPPYYLRDVLDGNLADNERSGLSKTADRLYTYIPPKWLPYTYRKSVNTAIAELRYLHLKRVMRKLGMARPILYLWHPSMVDMCGTFDESLVVYHIYDEYASFTDQTEFEVELLKKQEKQLLERADIVFVASKEILARKLPVNSNTHLVENAVDYDLFARAHDPATKVPDELLALPHPIIGCVISHTNYVDLKLLREVFSRRPDFTFVFVGVDPDKEGARDDIKALQSMPNVHFFGRRKITEIPSYLKGFDVCAIPYILTDVIMVASSPLKLYEYFASGKPIVSNRLPLLKHFDHLMEFAEGPDEWVSGIENALRNNDENKINQRQELARQNTWDHRAEIVGSMIAAQLAKPRRSAKSK